jgi:Ca2+-binding RTX toxin-like protein
MATFTGTTGDDRLRGSNADDLLIANGGTDILLGRGGADTYQLYFSRYTLLTPKPEDFVLRRCGSCQ